MSRNIYATPEQAEEAFYAAFERGDLAAMMDVWADREFVECIHPMADRAQGRSAVAESWQQIFDSGVRLKLRLTDSHRTRDALLAIHILYEHVSFAGQRAPQSRVIATNIYQLIEGSWRMVLHHASPAPGNKAEKSTETAAARPPGRRLH